MVNGQRAGNQVGLIRQDVTILANPRDIAGVLHFAQGAAEFDALVWSQPEFARYFDMIERAIVGLGEKAQNGFAQRLVVFHGARANDHTKQGKTKRIFCRERRSA